MYDEEERRQELLRRRAIRRRHKMREKRRRVRRRRFMLSVLVAAIVLFCLIRLGMLAYSAIHSRIDKTEQQAEQTEQIQSEKQTEQTESSYSMAIITTAAGLNVRTGPGTTYPRVTTLSGGTILSTDAEKDNWSQIAEGTYVNDWLCSDYISRLREEDGRATVTKSTSLYAGPSAANFQTIAPLETEDVVRLLYSAKVGGETWYEVQIQAYIGWIDADSIRIHEKH